MPAFEVVSPFAPAGDQPAAIAALVQGAKDGLANLVLEGITGSGKTATIAWTIEKLGRPTLIIEPNKALAAQLAAELAELLPNNRVEFFVSYYDYYQPEAYVASSDTFIEKESAINAEIERLRHSATASLLTRRDTVVVASVSCIYALGDPEVYRASMLALELDAELEPRSLAQRLVALTYTRNDLAPTKGQFRIKGDTVEIHPPGSTHAVVLSLAFDRLERISLIEPTTREVLSTPDSTIVFAATHYATTPETIERAVASIRTELDARLVELTEEGKLIEAQRIKTRTEQDLENLTETGICAGIENYARHFDGRAPGVRPSTLLDFFPQDLLVVLDESHITIPQLRGQSAGDRARKQNLVDHGFRLPSALDNRPLTFDEFDAIVPQTISVSATPGPYEREHADLVVTQVLRPTGLLDPEVVVRPTLHQVDDLVARIHAVTARSERVLVTTLTKKMAEDLTRYLEDQKIRVRYLHSDIDTLERIAILRDLRLGVFDVLVGINLLREGLDLPEVALVAILDADKEGFLRSYPSLVQTIGRAARNVHGLAVLYADRITDSMQLAIDTTAQRRAIQAAHNEANAITPRSTTRSVADILARVSASTAPAPQTRTTKKPVVPTGPTRLTRSQLEAQLGTDIDVLTAEMALAARELRFEDAAMIRDLLVELREEARDITASS
jgi:excinuclease ABC subunit B